MYCEICEAINKNDLKKLIKLLEYKEVNGCLLEAIKKQLNISIIEKMYEKENNFEGCFLAFLHRFPENKEMIEKLFLKNTEFDLDCLLASHEDRELFERIFDKITNFDGYLRATLARNYKDKYVLMRLAGVTTNFEGCLKQALTHVKRDMEFINLLVKNTKDFKGCLRKSFFCYSDEKELMNFLIINTKNYKKCLLSAIFYCPENIEMINRIYDLTNDYSECLENAINECPDNIELIDRLIDVTEDLGPALSASSGNKKIFNKIFPKVKNFENILLNTFKNHIIKAELLDRIVENTIDFDGCFDEAIKFKYYHEKIFNNTTDFWPSLSICIEYWPENEELIKMIIDKTPDFHDAFSQSIIENNELSLIFVDKINEYFDSYLCDAIRYYPNNKELIYKLIDKCEYFEEPLLKAILYLSDDEELIELLFNKNNNKKLRFDSRFIKLLDKKNLGHLREKYIGNQEKNDKCKICEEEFKDEYFDILYCGHIYHKECNNNLYICRQCVIYDDLNCSEEE